MIRKPLLLICMMMLTAMPLLAKNNVHISVFADHIYDVAKQDSIPFKEAAKRVYDAGVRGVDVYVTMNPHDLQILDSLRFKHASAILVTDLVNGDCQAELQEALAFMHRNHFKRLLLVPGLLPEKYTDDQLGLLFQRIDRFTKQARQEGLTVTVEDYDNVKSPCYNTDCLDRMFTVCPSLGLTFDTGNFAVCKEDIMQAMKHFFKKIKHVHLKDRKAIGEWEVTPVGKGAVPIRRFVEELVMKEYTGWFTIECYGSKNMLEAIQTGVQSIKDITLPDKRKKK